MRLGLDCDGFEAALTPQFNFALDSVARRADSETLSGISQLKRDFEPSSQRKGAFFTPDESDLRHSLLASSHRNGPNCGHLCNYKLKKINNLDSMAVDRVWSEPFSAEFPANREKYREIREFGPRIPHEEFSMMLNIREFLPPVANS